MRHGRHMWLTILAVSVVAAVVAGVVPLRAEGTRKAATAEAARAAALRGLEFTEKDAATWRTTKKCASCHQGIMTAWTLEEARTLGYPVRPELQAETFGWCRERFTTIDQPRGADLNSRTVSAAALMFGLMALTNPGQTSLPPAELARLGTHFVNTQDTNGSWTWSGMPAGNRPPPVFESDEVATQMAYLCLEGVLPADRQRSSAITASREKAAAWLAGNSSGGTTQSAALRLYIRARNHAPNEQREAALAALLGRQKADGGWGQAGELPSDGFATGQALYFLQLSGLQADRAEIRRGIQFLVADQREDGSWKVTPRAHPGAKPFTHPEPIVSFGTAWATMALMRLVPSGK